ncbi:MAG: acyl transferase [Roseivirga sp.]|nr:acyl transferase [Roseivirga sp.]
MEIFKSLYQRVFSLTPETFEPLALELFNFQYTHNTTYKAYVDNLTVKPQLVTKMTQIPFLPIELFKRHEIKTGSWNSESVFESSGTTGAITSKHHVFSGNQYLHNCQLIFEQFYGKVSDYTVLALLPSYLERENSSLVYMARDFICKSNDARSDFFLNDQAGLAQLLTRLQKEGKPTLLLGVTFGLLDLAESFNLALDNVIIMETGGMKGRRKEMLRSEVHEVLTYALGVNSIHSEYGMTELFSQAYSKGQGIFTPGSTMRVLTRDINDPLHISVRLRSGGLNIVDLANIHSCCFIETKDIGKVYENGDFEVLGRMDNSDIRGCNLMVV